MSQGPKSEKSVWDPMGPMKHPLHTNRHLQLNNANIKT